MPVILPPAPPDGLEIVRRHALTLLDAAPEQSRMRGLATESANVDVTQPHRVYTATIADVLSGKLLANAKETAWRYFLVRGEDEPIAAAEVTDNQLSLVNEGPFVQGTAAAMIAAEQLDAAQARNWELRLLQIPALFTVAVWLTSAGDHLLIPAAPAPAGLVANEPFQETAFTDALRPLAEQRSEPDPDDLRG